MPLSRSAVISAITAKIAMMTKTCVETGPIRLMSGSMLGSGSPSVMSAGSLLISQAFDAPRARKRPLTRKTIHERRARRHSVSSRSEGAEAGKDPDAARVDAWIPRTRWSVARLSRSCCTLLGVDESHEDVLQALADETVVDDGEIVVGGKAGHAPLHGRAVGRVDAELVAP